MKVCSTCALLLLLSLSSIAQTDLSGRILDTTLNSPVPFATLVVSGEVNGTISDVEGYFNLSVADDTDSIEVRCLGYETRRYAVSSIITDAEIRLSPFVYAFDEVIIRPSSPEEQLKKSVRRMKDNYSNRTYGAYSHYKESLKEDGRLLRFEEAGLLSTISPKKNKEDKEARRHQVILHHKADSGTLEFMRKKAEKQKAKYLKKNPEKAEEFEEGELFLVSFGGPDMILELDVTDGDMSFLDSTRMKHYSFTYGPESQYGEHALLRIDYETKGKEDHRRCTGSIFIDKSTDAIVSLREQGRIIIPAAIRPIIFAAGYGIKNPTYSHELAYTHKDGRWYTEKVRWDIMLDVTKKKLFKENEKAEFDIYQSIVFSELMTDESPSIHDAVRFDPKKKMSEQIHAISGIGWEQVK